MSLLSRAQSNDPQAWVSLVSLYTPLVYQWCRRQNLSPEESRQIGEEVFSHVFHKLSEFQKTSPPESFHSWILRITLNKIVDGKNADRNSLNNHSKDESPPLNVTQRIDDADLDVEFRKLQRDALQLLQNRFKEREWEIFLELEIEHSPKSVIEEKFGCTSLDILLIQSRVHRHFRQEYADLFNLK